MLTPCRTVRISPRILASLLPTETCAARTRLGLSSFLLALSLPGCNWLLEQPLSTSKTLHLPKPTPAIRACVAASPASCPADGSGAGDVHAVSRYEPLDTSFDIAWLAGQAGGSADVARQKQDERISASAPAIRVLNHDVQKSINQLFNAVNNPGSSTGGDVTTTQSVLSISLDGLDDYLSLLEQATAQGSWDALAAAADSAGDAVPQSRRTQVSFVSEYLSAYFRNGKFFEAKLDATAVKANLTAKLQQAAPALSTAEAQSLADSVFAQAGLKDGAITFGSVADSGFVTRGGQQFKFPAVQAELTLPGGHVQRPSIDYTSIGTDLLRVYLHAIFDAKMQVPAVSNATGVKGGLKVFHQNPAGGTTDAQFAEIETRANEAEALSAAGVGRVVRGIGFFSLNNEAVATIVETIVGVSLRKETEKVMWCWYQCSALPGAGDFQARDYNAPMRTITVRFTAKPKAH